MVTFIYAISSQHLTADFQTGTDITLSQKVSEDSICLFSNKTTKTPFHLPNALKNILA